MNGRVKGCGDEFSWQKDGNPVDAAVIFRVSSVSDTPSLPTIRKFFDYLVDAYLFRKAERYDVRGKRYLDYPSKYYAEDIG